MYYKKLLVHFLIWGGQLVAFITVYKAGWQIRQWLAIGVKQGIDWGIMVVFALWVFAALSLAGLIVNLCVWPRRQLRTQAVLFLLFVAFCADSLRVMPYRTSLLLLCGLIGFALPLLFYSFAQRTISPRRGLK